MKKTNKTFKRFAAITSASLLAACAVMPAISSAADITISGSADSPYVDDQATHSYEAYQIFTGTLSGTTLSDINWGTGVSVNATSKIPERTYTPAGGGEAVTVNIYDELKNLDLGTITNPFQKYNADKSAKIALTSAEEVANALTGLDFDHKTAKEFANTVAKYLSTNPDNKKTSDNNNKISDLADGYYLVQDATAITGEGAKTRYILKVAGEDIKVKTKSSYPTVMKKVQEESLKGGADESVIFGGKTYNPGDGYNDVADYDIGDDVPFKLYGTMPSGYTDYDKYFYCFRDTLGSQFDTPDNITVNIVNTTDNILLYYKWDNEESKYVQYTNLDAEGTAVVTPDDNCNVTFDNGAFAVAFGDILKYKGVSAATKVTVSYTARLNDTANVGYDGQINGVKLEYSNNPNEEYGGDYNGTTDDSGDKPETGITKEDGVIVFTYGFDINKVITGETTKLADAYFAVYYETSETVGDETVTTKHYIRTNADNTYKDTTTEKPELVINADKTDNADNAVGIWKSNTTGNITILGLDKDKTYYVEELKAPATYNALKEPVAVTIASSKTSADSIYQQGWTYSLAGNIQNGTMTAVDNIQVNNTNVENQSTGADIGTIKIENSQGSTLPGTGGIGTTIFYLGGGAMAAIGGVYLISKRRMKKSEE